mmetsp:Transcript_78220/g.217213  ORF Transcript_78220/g.217213 Transcript_78220/m.217213 type:complete len:208 (-) Transcript_78220:222-845(-)
MPIERGANDPAVERGPANHELAGELVHGGRRDPWQRAHQVKEDGHGRERECFSVLVIWAFVRKDPAQELGHKSRPVPQPLVLEAFRSGGVLTGGGPALYERDKALDSTVGGSAPRDNGIEHDLNSAVVHGSGGRRVVGTHNGQQLLEPWRMPRRMLEGCVHDRRCPVQDHLRGVRQRMHRGKRREHEILVTHLDGQDVLVGAGGVTR